MTDTKPANPNPVHPMQDDRTEAQCLTHICLVKGRDTFMSGWGGAEGGASYAVWACKPEHLDAVYEWVKGRDDMVGVTAAFNPDTFRLLRGDRLHIYVVRDTHPALGDHTRPSSATAERRRPLL